LRKSSAHFVLWLLFGVYVHAGTESGAARQCLCCKVLGSGGCRGAFAHRR
jgi:hypothetical protein